jgi:hypothetical protein
LPEVAGVSFVNVDDEEGDAVAVLLVELVERGNLPAKRRSSIAAEDEDDGLLAAEGGEGYGFGMVEKREGEVGGFVANLEMAGAGLLPHGLKREEDERDRADAHHEAGEFFGRLAHGVEEEGECEAVDDDEWDCHAYGELFPECQDGSL